MPPGAPREPGFGHSERRAALLSPRAIGEFVRLVVSLSSGFGADSSTSC